MQKIKEKELAENPPKSRQKKRFKMENLTQQEQEDQNIAAAKGKRIVDNKWELLIKLEVLIIHYAKHKKEFTFGFAPMSEQPKEIKEAMELVNLIHNENTYK